jgi:octaprenyl-diphosphate synthase
LNLETIKQPIQKEMTEFEHRFREAMRSSTPLLDRIMHYIVKRKGKQMRPMFVFLSAGMCRQITDSTYTGASLIELLHTATLVHDDVVDDSLQRRGFFSINALWKNKIAVLVGDYLLSRGLLIAVERKEFAILEIVSRAVKMMSEGELLQLEKARKLDVDEAIYYDIIRQKTASLIASCCAVGAQSSGAERPVIERMRLFGELAGQAFQIKDDLFEFEKNLNTGKPAGIDIKDSKMTLPLIHALRNASSAEKRRIIKLIKSSRQRPEDVATVIQFVNESGGLKYAAGVMNNFRQQALDILKEFNPGIYRQSLEQLVMYSTERRN